MSSESADRSGPGPRDYAAATERALYAFSGTKCYFPNCSEPVIVFVGGEPVSNVHIAHIRGANPGAPRYDATMTNDQRRAFTNLLLLCKPHHEVVDKRHPDRYSVETLTEWKAERESAAGIDGQSLAGITEDRLFGLIEQAVAASRERRQLEVEVGMGFAAQGQAITFPTETAKDYLDLDMYKDLGPPLLILTVRNTGSMKAYVAGHAIRFVPSGAALFRVNHFPFLNPRMPHALDRGDSTPWFYDLPMVTRMVAFMRECGQQIDTLVAEVTLGSGEKFESSPLSAAYLP